MFRHFSAAYVFLAVAPIASISAAENAGDFFSDQIAPLLSKRCFHCHSNTDAKGGLSLSTAETLAAGGDSGDAVVAGAPDESMLIEMVIGDPPEMPKGEHPLSAAEVNDLRKWIESGAVWADGFVLEEPEVTDTAWWSLQPLRRPAVPKLSDDEAAWARSPIDAFVLAQQAEHGLKPNPDADRRTLIRRLHFDLIGLPPSYEEVESFVHDTDPQAYDKLVQRLLDSPHYGERWARHWLDVVHYGDTHGYDKDKLRPNAWPYRDYVIRSLNEDKPYARFVMEQVAGDVFWPHSVDGVEGTGFIAAGPWDFIGHAEVPEEKLDGQVARHLDRDDMVSSTMNTFVSLTVQCARCHNHKFDPITQEHYYSLQAVFAALDRADREYDRDPQVSQHRHELKSKRNELVNHQSALIEKIAMLGGDELAKLEVKIDTSRKRSQPVEPLAFGYHSAISMDANQTKWVEIDLGQSTDLSKVTVVGCKDDFNGIGVGFGFPKRFRIEAAATPEFDKDVRLVSDQTQTDFDNPGVNPVAFATEAKAVRYIRMTATKLALRSDDYIFAIAELIVHDHNAEIVSRGQAVQALDSIEAPPRWQQKNLVDGIFIGQSGTDTESVEAELTGLIKLRDALLTEKVPAEVLSDRSATAREVEEIDEALSALPPPNKVYAGTIHRGNGAFRGTAHNGGRPREIHVLARGNISSPGQRVQPGTVPIIPTVHWQFPLEEQHAEGDRRAALARWLIRNDNPLTWRSIVNRIWQYHFGRGIVDSPNDFGRMGQQPTHPQLLNWLAVEFRDNGQSLKDMHRLIVTSSTYRQTSDDHEIHHQRDANNRYLWRMNRRVLDAEGLRDAVLAISGKLDRGMYGPGFRDFVIERPEHSPHYEYHLHDPNDAATHRRSVYRFLVRSQQQPFMQTLDCADPSESVAKRNTTLTSIQALALLNNKLIIRMAEHFAADAVAQANDLPDQVDYVYRTAFGKSPNAEVAAALIAMSRQHGLANTCRVVFNLNEFVFID